MDAGVSPADRSGRANGFRGGLGRQPPNSRLRVRNARPRERTAQPARSLTGVLQDRGGPRERDGARGPPPCVASFGLVCPVVGLPRMRFAGNGARLTFTGGTR